MSGMREMPSLMQTSALSAFDQETSRLRLQTIVRLRWLAVIGQTATVATVYWGLGFALPIGLCLLVIALSAWLNIFLRIRYPASHRLKTRTATLMLSYDTLQLAALLYLTGGLQNPFGLLIVVPVTVSATTHTVPSFGFVVWQRRRKLKTEYQDLSGDQIRDLRMAGTDVTDEIRIPKLAYLGDSAPAGLDACEAMFRAENEGLAAHLVVLGGHGLVHVGERWALCAPFPRPLSSRGPRSDRWLGCAAAVAYRDKEPATNQPRAQPQARR